MKPFTYIPPPNSATYWQGVSKLAPEADILRPDQHVVSRVVLDRFAEPFGTKGERKVRIFSRDYPASKPSHRGPAGCGKFPNFVRFASRSVEEVWAQTETLLPGAMRAADSGTFYDEAQNSIIIRNAIVLHLVRSIPSMINSDNVWRSAHAAHIERLLATRREELTVYHRERFKWTATNDEHLRNAAESFIAPASAQVDRGIFFRVSIEERYRRFCTMLLDQPVELRRSFGGDLVIGDAPLLMLRRGHPQTGLLDGPGLGNCDEVVLPLGPRIAAVLGTVDEYTDMDQEGIDRINAAQVRASADFVYARPSSGLDQFFRNAASGERPNAIPAHLRQGKAPRRLDSLAGRKAQPARRDR